MATVIKALEQRYIVTIGGEAHMNDYEYSAKQKECDECIRKPLDDKALRTLDKEFNVIDLI